MAEIAHAMIICTVIVSTVYLLKVFFGWMDH